MSACLSGVVDGRETGWAMKRGRDRISARNPAKSRITREENGPEGGKGLVRCATGGYP